MLDIVTYSYLIFPLLFLLFIGKQKNAFIPILALYGICFFCMIYFDDWIPKKDIKKYYQGFYTLLEYTFFTYFVWANIRSKKFKNFIIVISLLFILFEIVFIPNTPRQKLDSVPIGIETILILIYIFYSFYEFSNNVKDVFIYNHYYFWIAVGIMIYLGGSFFFYILVNYLDKAERAKFGNIALVAEIIKNILFTFSMFVFKKFPLNKVQNHPKKIPNLDMI